MGEQRFVIVTRGLAEAYWGTNRPLQQAPAGLYLTRGDGVAVEVTAEMLASAAYPQTWADFSDALRCKLMLQAQKLIDAMTKGASNV